MTPMNHIGSTSNPLLVGQHVYVPLLQTQLTVRRRFIGTLIFPDGHATFYLLHFSQQSTKYSIDCPACLFVRL